MSTHKKHAWTSLSCLSLSRPGAGLIAAITLSAGMGVSLAHGQEINDEGWTVLEPSSDTRFVFVSSSSGNDSNSGFSPANAVKSFVRAKSLMRDGSSDWMLLKRGDVWYEGLGWWDISGRSAEERLVITSYGESDERPKLVISQGRGIGGKYHSESGNIAIVGLHMQGDRSEGQNVSGIAWLATGENLLIEDCRIEGFKDNVTCQASDGEFRNFALRRSVILDSWAVGSHSQGVFVSNTVGAHFEENLIDHNGWNEDVAGAYPTIRNQNVYIQTSVTGTEFHGNLTSRASAAGVQMRSGGHASHNLAYANPLGMRFGYSSLAWPEDAATGSMTKNVILGGEISDDGLLGSGTGIWFERVADTLVSENVVAQWVQGSVNWAYSFHGFMSGINFEGNVGSSWGVAIKSSAQIDGVIRIEGNSWDMPGASRILEFWHMNDVEFLGNTLYGFDLGDNAFRVEGSNLNFDEWANQSNVEGSAFEAGLFVDSGRNLDGYARSIGLVDALGLIEAARGQSRANWDSRLTGRAAADWIRAGYITE